MRPLEPTAPVRRGRRFPRPSPHLLRPMKSLCLSLLLTLSVLPVCRGADRPARAALGSGTNTFRITGMHCAGCAGGLEAELRLTPRVARATVTLTNATAVVAFDTNRVATAKLLKVIEEAGFKGTVIEP